MSNKTATLLMILLCATAAAVRAGEGEDLADQNVCRTVHPLNGRTEALLRYGNAAAEVYFMRRLVNDGERDYRELETVEAAARAAGERLRQADPQLFEAVQTDPSAFAAMKYGSYGPTTRIRKAAFAALGLLDGSDYTTTDGECYGRIPAADEPL